MVIFTKGKDGAEAYTKFAKASIPVAIIAFGLVVIQNILLDKRLEREFGKKNK